MARMHWTSYFCSGSIAVIASWVVLVVLSGCRFGNHLDPGPQPDIGISGYYYTAPAANFNVITDQTGGGSHNVSVPSLEIPSFISAYVSDPSAFLLIDPPSQTYAIFPPMSGGYPSQSPLVTLNPDNSFGSELLAPPSIWSTNTQWVQAWTDSACQIGAVVTLSGRVTGLQPGDAASANTDLGSEPVLGHLVFQATYVMSFQGSCQASWQAMSTCYQTLESCPGATDPDRSNYQDQAQGYYKFFVEAGAMSAAEIATTSTLQFTVDYQ